MIEQHSLSFADYNAKYSPEEQNSRDYYIKQIIDKYADYNEDTNFGRFSTLGLIRILEYGDERSLREEYEHTYASIPEFYTNSKTGKRESWTQPLDSQFQAREDVRISMEISKNCALKNIIKTKKYTETEARVLYHLEILLGIQDGKFEQLLKTLENNLKEIGYTIKKAKIKGDKNLVKFLAACIVKYGAVFYLDVTNHDIKYELCKLGVRLKQSFNDSTDKLHGTNKTSKIVNAYLDFSLSKFNTYTLMATDMNFYQIRKSRFCEENDLYEKYEIAKWIEFPDPLIKIEAAKIFALQYVSELFEMGIIEAPVPINNFLNKFETQYKGFFSIRQNISIVITVVSVRLFNPHLSIPSLIRDIMSIGECSYDTVLQTKIESQCRSKEKETKTHDGTATIWDHIEYGTIRCLYNENYDQKEIIDYDIDEIIDICRSEIDRFFVIKVNSVNITDQENYSKSLEEIQEVKIQSNWDIRTIIITKHDLSMLNYSIVKSTYKFECSTSPVVTNSNHITYFNKKDG